MRTFTSPQTILLSFLTIFFLQVNAQIINSFQPKSPGITAFSATPDGTRIALGNNHGIEIRDTESDAIIYNTPMYTGVSSMCLREDGNALLVAFDSQDKSASLLYWDFKSSARFSVPHTHLNKILCVAISPDGNLIASGSKDKTIRIYETKFFKEIRTLSSHHSNDITDIQFSPDSRYLLSGSKDKKAILWDLVYAEKVVIFKGNTRKINDVVFSPDGKLIATAGDDMIIRIWDTHNNQGPLYELFGHKDAITSIDFTPDGMYIGSASKDRSVRLWNYENRNQLSLRNGIGTSWDEPVNRISFYDGGNIFTMSGNRIINCWSWGFPILSIDALEIDDYNKNNKIEGTEEVKLKFNIVNKGEGSALNLKFTISESKKVEGLTYPNSLFIENIPARTAYPVEVHITSSEKLKNGWAKFNFSDFMMMSYSPYSMQDTSIMAETMASPYLKIEAIRFEHPDTTETLAGNKSGIFNIYLKNSGLGMAKNVQIKTSCDKPEEKIEFEETINVGNIGSTMTEVVKIPVKAGRKVTDGTVNFSFVVSESSGISHASINHSIKTSKYVSSLIEEIRINVEDKIIAWQAKSKWETTNEYKARVTEKTRELQIAAFTQKTLDSLVKASLQWSNAITDYDADNTSFKIMIRGFDPVFLQIPRDEAEIFDAQFKQYKIDNMSYTINKNNFAFLHFDLTDTLSMNKKYTYNSSDMVAFSPTLLNFNFDPVNINSFARSSNNVTVGETRQISVGSSDVDINIPQVVVSNPNIYAVVIGNEDYKRYQIGLKSESNVEFAEKDAETFANYLMSTYGVPKDNIRLHKNATYVTMNQELTRLSKLAAAHDGNAELIFYYSGHGLPDENTGEGYLIPVDVAGSNLRFAVKLSNLYAELSKYPTKKVTVFLDACFSGGGRTEGLLASKSVKIKPKDETVNGNLVVFTSSSGDESSGFYKDKQHGLFTYYLLKKIQETKGSVDYQSLFDYLKHEVNIKSLTVNSKEQNPQMIVSYEFPVQLNKVSIGSMMTSYE